MADDRGDVVAAADDPRMLRRRGVAAVLRLASRGDEVLMVQHTTVDRVWWTLPGGEIEPDEAPSQCAIRELREETGLEGRVVRHLYDWTGPAATESCWLLEVEGGTPILGHDPELPADEQELTDVAWFPVDEVHTDRQIRLVLLAIDAGAEA